jgi:hypothetical protein
MSLGKQPISRLIQLLCDYKKKLRRAAIRKVQIRSMCSSRRSDETKTAQTHSIEVKGLVGERVILVVHVHVFVDLVGAVDFEVSVVLCEAFIDGETSLVHKLFETTTKILGIVVVTTVLDDFGGNEGPFLLVKVVLEDLLGAEETKVILVAHDNESSLESFVAVRDGAGAVNDAVELGVAGLALVPGSTALYRSQREFWFGKQQKLTSRMLIKV